MSSHRLAAVLLIATLLAACGSPPDPAAPSAVRADDHAHLAVTGARIWTGDPDRPWAEALAVRGERLVAVGSVDEVRPHIGPDTTVLQAAFVTPGFIDTHVHFTWGGDGLASVQLRDAATPEEFTERIAAFAAELQPGEWVRNGIWDHENWGGELPRRQWIDPVTADNPVWITRLDGHMALANSLALELAGVTADTPDVAGGEIVRDAAGNPTGVLKDNAMDLVARVVPPATEAELDRMVDAATAHLATQGVTSVHDMGNWPSVAAYRRARDADRLRTRIYAFVPLAEWRTLADEVAARGRGDDWLRIGGLKGFMDGSLGSKTAAFHEPFSDAPGERGLLVNDPETVEQWVRDADAHGLHIAIHAIGDRAIALLLDIYAGLDALEPPDRERRLRIEHAQHIAPDDIARFAELDVIASMQPYHAIDDGRWADRVIGPERALTTYAFASLLDAGVHVAFGSDWPVAPPSPLEGIYAAVTRRTLDDAHPEGWVPSQKIGVEQALAAYTIEAARAGFVEERLGTLTPGKLADFVVIDRDLTAIDPAGIRDARVLLTVVDGQIVHGAQALSAP
jgi:predicted amidohydrolase YtcJ